MSLRVYNTMSRELEEFKPNKDKEVKVYICGLTTYDYMHIGHARTYLAFDAILRYLKYRGYSVKYVQNVTDIDDKIINRAKEKGLEPLDLATEFAEKSAEDRKALGLIDATAYPTVSGNIDAIIRAVQTLINKGFAYEVDGDVYFELSKFPDYGRLSRQDVEQLNKHRIEPNSNKKNHLDFSLWKKSPHEEIGFESPWSTGRPGWHIECSALAKKYLGDELDIHGGALDLVFPHHENEIAQSESLTGKKPFVKYWMHTGFLQSSGEKMSKSLGNIIPVREFLKTHTADAFRLFILQTHYRSPIDYSPENITNAGTAVEKLINFRKNIAEAAGKANQKGEDNAISNAEKLRTEFIEAMNDDFNTPKAVAALFDSVRKLNSVITDEGDSNASLDQALKIFDEVVSVLGLQLKAKADVFTPEELKLIDERNKHRKERNWAESDRIRNLLLEKRIKLTDKSDGTTNAERL